MSKNNERKRQRQITNNFAELDLLSRFSNTFQPSIRNNFIFDYTHLQSEIQKLKVELEETQKQLRESKNEIEQLKYQNYNLRRGIQEVQTISGYIQPPYHNQFSNVELPFNTTLDNTNFELHTDANNNNKNRRGGNKTKKRRTHKKK